MLFLLTPSPHIRAEESVRGLMFSVIFALVPTALAGMYFFGVQAISTIAVATASSMLFESLYFRLTAGSAGRGPQSLGDGSAAVTGLLLGLNLPPGFPWWGTVIGSFVAIILVKHLFGGLGYNIFNPALAARVFLLISWPVQMTAFPKPSPMFGNVDAVTEATPLTAVKMLLLSHGSVKPVDSVTSNLNLFDLLIGNRGGSIGEVSALMLLLGGAYLIYRRTISWHIPLSFICTVGAFSSIFYLLDPAKAASPVFHLLNGGLFLGAFFMATDYVTSPINKRGMLIFGAGCGFLTAIIRQYGSYPEGVSFAILLMNMAMPLIDKYLSPRRFGG